MEQNRTVVYLWDISALSETEWQMLFSRCSDTRQAKVEKLKRKADQNRSIAAETLLRFAVKDMSFTTDFSFRYGKNGKPYFVSGVPEFSLSHSGNAVMCAVSDLPVGCDTEQICPLRQNVASRFFTAEEYRALCDAPESERQELFYRFWTLKESYMKYTGAGLAISPASFEITLGKNIGIVPQNDCHFAEYGQNGYRFAVCGKRQTALWYRCTYKEEIGFVKERVGGSR